jgi:hypothetical protein
MSACRRSRSISELGGDVVINVEPSVRNQSRGSDQFEVLCLGLDCCGRCASREQLCPRKP